MRQLKSILRYILYMPLMLAALMVFNTVVMLCIQGAFGENKRITSALSATVTELTFDADGVGMTDKGRARIDSLDGFALLISENGDVIWDYKRPSDIPDSFSLCDVVSFSRWYMCDYPVYSYIIETPPDGSRAVYVLGQPKGSLWKYQIVIGINSAGRFPYLILADIVILFAVPAVIIKRRNRRREKERVEWIAGVSHDIRTPLAMAMLGAARLADSPDSETAAAAKQILAQEMRLKSLVENLNADSRMLYGHGRPVREKVVLPPVIRDVLCGFADANDGSPYDFDCDIAPDAEGCVILSDEALVRRMLENIVGNSIRHNPDGCRIRVELHRGAALPLRSRCVLSISDDGRGAPPDVIAALNRGSSDAALREHGLGLRVVNHIAKEYRWKVRYAVPYGGGFSVSIYLFARKTRRA